MDYLKGNKKEYVQGVFSSVAKKYDIMNDLMSLGLHRKWKDKMVNNIILQEDDIILDVAAGTGDIAMKLCKRFPYNDIYVLDINYDMLINGMSKVFDKIGCNGISWMCGNAEEIPLNDDSVGVYTIAFGIRNVNDINKALKEAYRVLLPGKKFICMEFGKIRGLILSEMYDVYSKILPFLGDVVTKDRESYQYLVDSIKAFPEQELFCNMMRKTGFLNVKYENILGGVVAIYEGIKDN